jgi:hypothetical protein
MCGWATAGVRLNSLGRRSSSGGTTHPQQHPLITPPTTPPTAPPTQGSTRAAAPTGAEDAVVVVAVDEGGVRHRLLGAHAVHHALQVQGRYKRAVQGGGT